MMQKKLGLMMILFLWGCGDNVKDTAPPGIREIHYVSNDTTTPLEQYKASEVVVRDDLGDYEVERKGRVEIVLTELIDGDSLEVVDLDNDGMVVALIPRLDVFVLENMTASPPAAIPFSFVYQSSGLKPGAPPAIVLSPTDASGFPADAVIRLSLRSGSIWDHAGNRLGDVPPVAGATPDQEFVTSTVFLTKAAP